MAETRTRLLIAASGTGGHLFPAIAVAEQLTETLPDASIEWLGVPDRLENQLVPDRYPLHQVRVEGFQTRFGLNTFKILGQFVAAIFKTRQLLQKGQFQAVFTTGGYIAAPAIIAAKTLGLPTILHESNALPGKVTRFLSPWCTTVAVGFEAATHHLPRAQTVCVGTPVRSQFLSASEPETHLPDLPIPPDVPVITIIGGSQGAVAVNRLIRQSAPAWFEAGIWVVHLTGENDPEANSLHHPQYLVRPFYNQMAPLLRRTTLVVSRAGAGTLTELAIVGVPAIQIPYPFAAEDHQSYNAEVFVKAGAARMIRQEALRGDRLTQEVLILLKSPETLQEMGRHAKALAVPDSAERLAKLVRELIKRKT
ncbi:MAG: undecaprenyldiphospho-muramoylpentapeptide beta-N-acetylglucosaminyltransferase [Leptolyngbyaceae cyanobacterium bins.59]|nr:undecaprenyldiphospho-muramoylpentapeptide beta-N-acetylglucosaminyltransferase [Leptolyngbyaceae cyanobacterium bins.59]